MSPSEPILTLHDISLGQSTAQISLQVFASEFVVLAGPAGAEKSGLLLTAAGFREAQQGSVRLLNTDLTQCDSDDHPFLRLKTGFVFQEPIFIHNLSALENIRLPLRYDGILTPQAMTERVQKVLQAAGLLSDLSRTADDLCPLDRRKLALARAWIREPEIVFYDEPAKGLDPGAQKKIYQTIHGYHEKRNRGGHECAALLACNDPRWVLEFADRYLVLSAGTLTSKADQTNIRGRKETLEKEFLDFVQAI